MKERQKAKRALFTSAISLILCMVMMIATTLAWFTDSVGSTNNRIQAGSLKIKVTAFDYDHKTGAFTELGDLSQTTTPAVINDEKLEPGSSRTKYIRVENIGNLDLEFKAFLAIVENQLQDSLWFDYGIGQAILIPDTAMNGPEQIKGATGLSMDAVEMLAGSPPMWIRLDYGMNKCAGNTYQLASLLADIHVVATQTEANTGVDYDAKVVTVSTVDEFIKAITERDDCPTIVLLNNIDIPGGITSTQKFNLDLNGKTLTIDGDFTMTLADVDPDDQVGTMDLGDSGDGGKIVLLGTGVLNTSEIDASAITLNKNFDLYEQVQKIAGTTTPAGIVAAINTAGGGTYLIPEGEYGLKGNNHPEALMIKQSGVTIIGEPGTVFTDNIGVDPNISNFEINGITFKTTADDITWASSDQIAISPGASNVAIRNCNFIGFTNEVPVGSPNSAGIATGDINAPGTGINGFVVDNCYFENFVFGTYVNPISKNVEITNNTYNDCQTALVLNSTENGKVLNNTFTKSQAIRMHAAYALCKNIEIANNTFVSLGTFYPSRGFVHATLQSVMAVGESINLANNTFAGTSGSALPAGDRALYVTNFSPANQIEW